jgi:uncharacterized protein (TIGR03083 family)
MTFDWAGIVEREGAALGHAAASDLSAPIPGAPGWDAADLLRHISVVHGRGRVILETGTLERPTVENGMIPAPPEDGLVEWYLAGLGDLVTAIRALDEPDRPAYSFSPRHRYVGFWPRRMGHETTIHRVDAEQAAGVPLTPIDPAVALDGIDEMFAVHLAAFGAGRSPGDGRTVHLHATDAEGESEGEWTVRFAEGDLAVEAGHAKGDAAVRGPAADLLLWVWGRHPLDDLEVFGDTSAAQALRTALSF